jgi:hypothetical protein
MTKQKITTAIACLAITLFGFYWTVSDPLNSSEAALFGRLEQILDRGKPSLETVTGSLFLASNCIDGFCKFLESDFKSDVDFRQDDDGIILILDHFQGQCIRIERARKQFAADELEQSCDHSLCWSYQARHDWGIVAFQVQNRDSPCITGVIVNSAAYIRHHN